jgi:NAD(P)-dependent dehydrogenase (short-subunit alcohol dehydrogenase family)
MTNDLPDYRDLFSLAGRVALVIGGGSGIGRAGAMGLAAFGATAVVADVNRAGAEETAHLIADRGGKADARTVDARSTASVDQLVADAVAAHGAVDVLLAMPAVNLRKRLVEYSDEEFDRVIDLNLKGTFRAARAVARQMMKQRRGSIILMSSMRGFTVEPGQSIYGSTKAGIALMTKGLASEMAQYGVRVNAIAPGIIATPLTQPIRDNPEWSGVYAARAAIKRWAEPSELVGPIVLLASEAGSYMTGTTVFVDGGWCAIDGRYDPPV